MSLCLPRWRLIGCAKCCITNNCITWVFDKKMRLDKDTSYFCKCCFMCESHTQTALYQCRLKYLSIIYTTSMYHILLGRGNLKWCERRRRLHRKLDRKWTTWRNRTLRHRASRRPANQSLFNYFFHLILKFKSWKFIIFV